MEPQLIHQGKVRDVYEWGSDLLLVASDRVSAFDVILPTPIPDKGILLTQLSRFWFEKLGHMTPNHVISFDLPDDLDHDDWMLRTTWCRKAQVIPMECVVRGYITGSGWKDYEKTGMIQGTPLPKGLRESDQLPAPIFTPTTKASAGHDAPLTEEAAIRHVGKDVYDELKYLSLSLYTEAAQYARNRGIIIADTKFEFGWIDGKIHIVDEMLTPDSSRFWPAESYTPGGPQPSFDKQHVRDYLLTLRDWNHQPPGPELPPDIVSQTRDKYIQAFEHLSGEKLNLLA